MKKRRTIPQLMLMSAGALVIALDGGVVITGDRNVIGAAHGPRPARRAYQTATDAWEILFFGAADPRSLSRSRGGTGSVAMPAYP